MPEQKSFTESEAVKQQLEEYNMQSDSVQMFIEEEDYEVNEERLITLKDLYSAYYVYCKESGRYPVNKRNFSDKLQKLGFKMKRHSGGKVFRIQKIGFREPTLTTQSTPKRPVKRQREGDNSRSLASKSIHLYFKTNCMKRNFWLLAVLLPILFSSLAFKQVASPPPVVLLNTLRMDKSTFADYYPVSTNHPLSKDFGYFSFTYYVTTHGRYGLKCRAYDKIGNALGKSFTLTILTGQTIPAQFTPQLTSSLTLRKSTIDSTPPNANYDLLFVPHRYDHEGVPTRYISYDIIQDTPDKNDSSGKRVPFVLTRLYTINPSPPA